MAHRSIDILQGQYLEARDRVDQLEGYLRVLDRCLAEDMKRCLSLKSAIDGTWGK